MKKMLFLLILIMIAFLAGHLHGVRHTIRDAIMWDDSSSIYLLLDGNIYEHLKGD